MAARVQQNLPPSWASQAVPHTQHIQSLLPQRPSYSVTNYQQQSPFVDPYLPNQHPLQPNLPYRQFQQGYPYAPTVLPLPSYATSQFSGQNTYVPLSSSRDLQSTLLASMPQKPRTRTSGLSQLKRAWIIAFGAVGLFLTIAGGALMAQPSALRFETSCAILTGGIITMFSAFACLGLSRRTVSAQKRQGINFHIYGVNGGYDQGDPDDAWNPDPDSGDYINGDSADNSGGGGGDSGGGGGGGD